MLIEAKGDNDGTACSDENGSVHGWTSRENNDDVIHVDDDAFSWLKGLGALGGTFENENNDVERHGVLILEGDEGGEDKEGDEEESKRSKIYDLLSVPKTVFLPSEIRSVTVASGVTQSELNKNEGEETSDGNMIDIAPRRKCPETVFQTSEMRSTTAASGAMHPEHNEKEGEENSDGDDINIGSTTGAAGVGALKGMRLTPSMLVFAALLLPFALWRAYVWKNEALRLRQEARMQRSLLPLALSLLKERDSLLKIKKQLEEELRLKDGPGCTDYDDSFLADETDESPILSFKNCYAEGSLYLGPCSKEWQGRWFDAAAKSSERDADKEITNEYCPFYDGFTDDGFTENMSKLIKRFETRLARTTSRLYSFVERSVKYWSYDGIKATLSKDQFIQSIVRYTPGMASNDTGD